jgi:hypothetical protein
MEELYEKFNYPSLAKFKQILKEKNISTKGVEEFIKNQNVAQVHKPVVENKEKQKFIFALQPFEMVQLDLLDYQKYSRQNKGYKYILIGVDIFSRKAFAEPIKNKTPNEVLTAFKKFGIDCVSLFHDSGNEFKGSFLSYLNENNIIDMKAEIGDHHSLGVIDRFSKTLKTIISKYMTNNNTTKWVNRLPTIIQSYNETPHNSLGDVSPESVFTDKEHYKQVSRINSAKMLYNKHLMNKNNKISVGDNVRIKLKKKQFQKGYEITYSNEVYKVESISGEKAVLSDDKKHKLDDLIVANGNVNMSVREKADKEAKVKRKLRKEGII